MASSARGHRLAALFIVLFIIGWMFPVDLAGLYRAQYSAFLPLALRASGATPVDLVTNTPTATELPTAGWMPTHTATRTRTPTPTATTPTQVTCPQLGGWDGTTGEGYDVEFTISDQPSCQVSRLEILVWCPSFAWRSVMGPVPIVQGSFEAFAHNGFLDVDISVTGGFPSSAQASGTWFVSGECQGTWSASANPEHVYQGVTEQDKPILLGVSPDYSMVTWVELERTVSCDGVTAYRGGRTSAGSGWPIVDRAFFIEVPDTLVLQGTFDASYVTVDGTWQGIIAGPYHPSGGSCRSPIGRWGAALQ